MTMNVSRPRNLLLISILLVAGGLSVGYWILLSPGSIWVRWARAAVPSRITMITFGPYPSAKELQKFRAQGGKYVVSLLDPRLPYEKELIERETKEARKDGLIIKDFPMASVFDHKIFSNYKEEEERAVEYLKHLNGPAYVHCYLGRHRVLHVRNALLRAGVPASYWTPTGTRKQYWELINRLAEARKEFAKGHYARVITILEPMTARDVGVADLRGWSHYHMGLYSQAVADFKAGLEVNDRNSRDLSGLGYCYLEQGQLVLAQRVFHVVLNQAPQDESALVGQGLAFLALGNRFAATRMFRRALALDPNNPEASKGLKRAEKQ